MTKIVTRVYDHYEEHEAKYKYLIFPILWILGMYFFTWAFVHLVVVTLEIIGKTL